jgi:outer membrane protein TolC
MTVLVFSPVKRRVLSQAAILIVFFHATGGGSQQAPPSPNHPWHSSAEQDFRSEAKSLGNFSFSVDAAKTYSLAELIDLGETQNPETRLAWERARAEAAALGVARSELYPTLAATALAEINSGDTFFGTSFYRQTIQDFDGRLDLNYTIFDFGARSGRINAAKAEVLAADFIFNDEHRRVIYTVEQAYYQLLNAAGQMDAASASLTNAQVVQQSAEDRLRQGLATSPDVLEARSAAAQADYELQAALGVKEIAQGALAKALGVSPTVLIHAQPLDQLSIPDSIPETADQSIDRALAQRPDLMQRLAEVRSANARVKEARAAYFPKLSLDATGGGQSYHATQDSMPWEHTSDLAGGIGLSLTWSLFDGGLRKNNLARTKAEAAVSAASVNATRDDVAEEVWRAYSNLQTAFRERQSALALLAAAEQSYAATLESYNRGVRNLLDVTAAQRTLALARSTDVLARTRALSALAELAFRTGDAIQPKRTGP